MPMPPIPMQRYLVPPHKPTTPQGFTQVDVHILTGLPYPIALTGELQVIVVMPTGLAVPWRDADPAASASSSEAELSPATPQPASDSGGVTRSPLRLVVQQLGRTIGVVPLAAGLRRVVPDSGSTGLGGQIEIVILDWDVRAGSVRGAGDFGSRLSLAWRPANRATERYSPPPVHPMLLLRLEPQFRVTSELGLETPPPLKRFATRKDREP